MDDRIITDAAGRKSGLRDALAANYTALFRFLCRMSGDEETARDLAQESMVKAITGFGRFRGASSFSTWLLSIAANLYRDGLRRKRPITRGDTDDLHDAGISERRMERKIDADNAWRLLSELPERKRKALVLRLEFGYSYQEISKILGCPVGTVRSRIHEGIGSLRKSMGEDHER